MNFRLNDIFSPNLDATFPKFIGPPGIGQFMSDYSQLSELRAVDNWPKIEFIDYQSHHQLGNSLLTPFSVVHSAFNYDAQAYSLRFEVNGKVVVFSGDTAICDGIRQAATHADLFICDCSFPNGVGGTSGQVHLTAGQIGEICHESQVKKLMLTHFYPAFTNVDLTAQVKENYSGDVTNCQDKMVIEI